MIGNFFLRLFAKEEEDMRDDVYLFQGEHVLVEIVLNLFIGDVDA